MKRLLIISITAVMLFSSVGFVFGLGLSQDASSSHSTLTNASDLLMGTSSSSSTNWAGYAVTGTGFTSVSGSFIVPALSTNTTSSGGHGNGHGKGSPVISDSATLHFKPGNGKGGSGSTSYAAFWAGIDGYNSNTVEQAGVLMTDSNGQASYSAWTEFYPAAPVYASWHPSPGDTIVVYVNYSTSSNAFTATVNDITTGQSYSNTAQVSGAARSSAEWIAEAPSSNSGVLPLANFGTVNFGQDSTGVASSNYATLGGVSQAIGSFSSVYQINMVSNPTTLKATTSTLSSDGTSFSVTWNSS